MMFKNETVLYEVNDQVATIKLNRPKVKNAVNFQMHEELYDAFQTAQHDENVRVIVLTGTEDSFSSGANIKSFPLNEMENFDHGEALEKTYNKLILLMEEIDKPTVAYLNGTAVGAGLSLALACDFRFADRNAKMALSFIKIGLTPDAGASYFLPRLVGLGKALELSLGEAINGEEALRIGLIHQLGDPAEFVAKLVHAPSPAYSSMKQNMKAGMHLSLRETLDLEVEGQRAAGKSPFHKQAIKNFIQGNRKK